MYYLQIQGIVVRVPTFLQC